MLQLTLIEKLQVLFDNVLAYPFFLILLSVPLIVWLMKRKGIGKKTVIIYLAIALILAIINYKNILKLLDNFVEYIITILNFPTMGLVLLVVITSFIIVILSALKKYKKSSKIINVVSFVIIQIMFGIVLTRINTYNIDFTKTQTLYANLDVVTLMQLIMGVFTFQLFILFIIKCIDKVTDYLERKDEIVKTEALNYNPNETLIPEEIITLEPVKNIDKTLEKITPLEELVKDNEQSEVKKENDLKPSLLNKYKTDVYEKNIPNVEEVPALENTEETLIDNKENYLQPNIFDKKIDSEVHGKVIPIVKETLVAEQKPLVTNIPNIDIFETKVNEPATKEENFSQNIFNIKEEKTEKGPVEIVKIDKMPSVSDNDLSIEEISSKIDNMNVSSNKFINEETRKQMQEELLAYKKQLIEYKQKQMQKEENLKKQMENFNSIFNITHDDLKSKY